MNVPLASPPLGVGKPSAPWGCPADRSTVRSCSDHNCLEGLIFEIYSWTPFDRLYDYNSGESRVYFVWYPGRVHFCHFSSLLENLRGQPSPSTPRKNSSFFPSYSWTKTCMQYSYESTEKENLTMEAADLWLRSYAPVPGIHRQLLLCTYSVNTLHLALDEPHNNLIILYR